MRLPIPPRPHTSVLAMSIYRHTCRTGVRREAHAGNGVAVEMVSARTARVIAFVVVCPAPSVIRTVKLNVLVWFDVPLIVPALDKDMPFGRFPPLIVHV